ncbi:MAG: hypothetical protein ACYTGN_00620 [Planctomycetota bacterium]|jgi:hypothetical protein
MRGIGIMLLLAGAAWADLDRDLYDYLGTADESRIRDDTPKPDREKRVHGIVQIYGWLAGVEGTVAPDTEIKIPFEELASLTTGGFQLYAEVRWRRLFVAFDGTWANLKVIDTARLDVDITQQIFDIRVGYSLVRKLIGGTEAWDPWRRHFTWDAFVGARYFSTETTVQLTLIQPTTRTIKDTRTDPFIGTRTVWFFAKSWAWVVRADIGGFGIGNAAQFTWQLETFVAVRLTKWLNFVIGYRVLSFDTIEGGEGVDLTQHGPVFGFGFNF